MKNRNSLKSYFNTFVVHTYSAAVCNYVPLDYLDPLKEYQIISGYNASKEYTVYTHAEVEFLRPNF